MNAFVSFGQRQSQVQVFDSAKRNLELVLGSD
jgi:hypothetical protein